MNVDETRKLIQKGTEIIVTLNEYRRGIFGYDKLYNLGINIYSPWKSQIFDHFSDNGIDHVKLDYWHEDDFLNRNFLKLCVEAETFELKDKIIDSVVSDVKRFIDELIKLEPLNNRLKITISDSKGIFQTDNTSKCYPLYGELRLKIIHILESGVHDARSIRMKTNTDTKPTTDSIKNINKAIKEMNELFRELVCSEYDLITIHKSKKYELNTINFKFIFTT